MVDTSGNARIVDFGLACIARDPSSIASNSDGRGYTPRWTAPEIFRGEAASRKSDVFSFAMVIFEVRGGKPSAHQPPYPLVKVFAGTFPFHDVTGLAVQVKITDGERPRRPNHPSLTDSLWILTQRCWKEGAQDRPEMGEMIKELKKLSVYSSSIWQSFRSHPHRGA